MLNRIIPSLVVCSLMLITGNTRGQDKPAADDIPAMLARADQAFADADYMTAVAIWTTLDGKIDPDKAVAIKERMRFAVKQLSLMKARGIDPTRAPAASSGTGGPTTQPARTPHKKPAAGETLEIGLAELGNFAFNPDRDSTLPEDVVALSGTPLRTTGYMIPLDQIGKVSRFLLVNDLMSCCFGNAPQLQHVIYVTLPEGKWVESTSERLLLEGELKVEVRKEDGYVLSLFELKPTSIKYAPQ